MTAARLQAQTRRAGPAPEAELSDDQLLERFVARRDDSAEAAFAALIRRHGPMVLRVCGQVLGDPHDAEDAFQACFLVLARKSGSIRQPELLGNWLYGVALRTAREAKHRAGRIRQVETTAHEGVDRASPGAAGRSDAALIGREELAALHEEVARLPERYRVPLILCELEGLTYQEAASRLRCPVGTVGVRLLRARERLRTRLIRRGIAPATATALAYSTLNAGSAAGLIPGTLVLATARAALGSAAGDAAATGLVPAAILGLAAAVLRSLKVAQIRRTVGGVLVLGLAAPGFLGAFRPVTAPPEAGTVPLRLVAASLVSIPSAPGGLDVADRAVDPAIVAALAARARSTEPGPTLASLRPGSGAEVARGEVLFFKDWVANDPISPGGDGLGPVFNESSCVACHGLGAPGGAGPVNKNVVLLSATASGGGKLPKGLDDIHPGFRSAPSTVLHRYGTDPGYESWRESFLGVGSGAQSPRLAAQRAAPSSANGSQVVIDRLARRATQAQPGPGRFRSIAPIAGVTIRVSERNSPALFGAGLIDSIPAEILAEQASFEPAEIRGRVNRAGDGRVGRFGWKAQVGGLHDFVRSACAGELGLEVPGHAQSTSPVAPGDRARGLDLTQGDCDALVAYVRALPAPVAVDPDGPLGTADMTAGRHFFAAVGCTSCHAPTLGDVRGIYSDLLLHNMGTMLNDSGSYYGSTEPGAPDEPSPGEWRTPPLWGYRDSGPYLHDGRAETLDEAVALHQGQAAEVTERYFNLAPADRASIETFLKSLVAPSTTSAPGIVLAAQREAQAIPDARWRAESAVRLDREAVEAEQVRAKAEARRVEQAEAAMRRAQRSFQFAVNLERSGKFAAAIAYYREVVRDVPTAEEGRVALDRIADLSARIKAAEKP